jgi:hypothetical protein
MISVILYGRNDSYGYNLHKRGAISFNCIAEVLTHPDDEIIFVDTNTPDDLPTFPEAIRDTLTPRAKKLLRVLRVRPAAYERHKNGTRMKVLEPLCRNAGIRRCNPKNRWVLNSNTDMVFVPVKPGQALSEAVEDLPDGLYELPRFEMPEMLWESVDCANPQSIMDQFKLWGRRLHINEMVLGNQENFFDGPGDFQLAPRQQLFAIHGMNEQMVLGWHVDSNLCRRLFLLNGRTHSLLERYHAYHCDHTRVNTMMHTAEGGTANDWRKFVNEVGTPYLPEQAQTWGMPDELVEEIRLTDQQATLAGQCEAALPLWRELPAAANPALAAALVLCETVRDENRFSPLPHLEALMGREFLKWYQRLVKWNQRETVAALNARLELLEAVLPSAARRLAAALTEANEPMPTRGEANEPMPGRAEGITPSADREIVPQIT